MLKKQITHVLVNGYEPTEENRYLLGMVIPVLERYSPSFSEIKERFSSYPRVEGGRLAEHSVSARLQWGTEEEFMFRLGKDRVFIRTIDVKGTKCT